MVQHLRAYLDVLDSTSRCSSVHRSLETLCSEWDSFRATGSSSLIHVGFERFASEDLFELVRQIPGRVLLTGAAKYALSGVFETGELAVVEIDGMPIFVGKPRTAQFQRPVGDTLPPEARLRLTGHKLMEAVSILVQAEESQAKFVAERGMIEKKLVEAYWVLFGIEQSKLRFEFESDDFNQTNVEPSSRENASTSASLHSSVNPTNMAIETPQTLRHLIDQQLSLMSDREREVLSRRAGLYRHSATLAEIGESLGVSRERVRQIEVVARNKFLENARWTDEYFARLEALLLNHSFPVPLLTVSAIDPWFAGFDEYGEGLNELLDNLGKGRAHFVMFDEVVYVSKVPTHELESVRERAAIIFEEIIDEHWRYEDCKALVENMCPIGGGEFSGLVWNQVSRKLHFADDGNGLRLVSYGSGAESAVIAVLAASPEPLHYSEIASRVKKRLGRELDIRRVHNAAGNVGVVLGRGIYGLDKHIPLERNQWQNYQSLALDIMSANPLERRQWHVSELYELMEAENTLSMEGLSHYALNRILEGGPSLEHLNRMVWMIVESADSKNRDVRIERRQAIVRILEEAGGPLASEEIRRLLERDRGIGKYFQIFAGDPLIRTSRGLWGLNDRDAPVLREEQFALMESVKHVLSVRQKGIHESELAPLLARWGDESAVSRLVFSLSADDDDLKVSSGDYLYLESWGNPRRMNVREALQVTFDSLGTELRIEEIHREMEKRIERPIQKGQVSSTLKAMGATFIDANRTWILDSDDPAS